MNINIEQLCAVVSVPTTELFIYIFLYQLLLSFRIEIGEWVAVAYTDQFYIGIVKYVSEKEVTTEFLTGESKLKWPTRPDVDTHPANIILACRPVVAPDLTRRYSVINNREAISTDYCCGMQANC